MVWHSIDNAKYEFAGFQKQKYAACEHFIGNHSYCKIPNKKEPIMITI